MSFPCSLCDKVCGSGPGLVSHEKWHRGVSSKSVDAPPSERTKARQAKEGTGPQLSSATTPAPAAPNAAITVGDGEESSGLSDPPTMSPVKIIPSPGPLQARNKSKAPELPKLDGLSLARNKEATLPVDKSEKTSKDWGKTHPFYDRAQEYKALPPADFLRLPVAKRLKYQTWYDVALNEQEKYAQGQVQLAKMNKERDFDSDDLLKSMRGRRYQWNQMTVKWNGEYIEGVKQGLVTDAEEIGVSKFLAKRSQEVSVLISPELADPKVKEAIKKALDEADLAGLVGEEVDQKVKAAIAAAK
ncbi:Putative Zinc finger C2H2-type [Septoria linicola]|uniref:Zinc finger C2H2-type n=1 Tax=Septoria linicola TaxID=215465 RepID=A0A9Q9AWF9_9PEZI|nr:putative Zinc finger C2H2-type [Septoria linicola]USW54428.1 Putative Zinc finger C2H2-type [Septoria linicola]